MISSVLASRRQVRSTPTLAALLGVLWLTGSATAWAGDFYRTPNMTTPRAFHTATLLEDGKVLIAGGSVTSNTAPVASAELYDPVKGEFRPTGSMHFPRWGHNAVRLANGKVLILGGWIASFVQATASAEVYVPATGEFTLVGSMSVARADVPPIVLGCNGDWLVIGGTAEGNFGTATSRIDRFDPATLTFSHVADLARSRRDHAVAPLPNGQWLVLGGLHSCCNSAENALRRQSAELLTACGGGVGLLPAAMTLPRARLPQGRLTNAGPVLIVGGADNPPRTPELYLPGAGSFQPSNVSLPFGERPGATELLNGDLLLTGLEPAESHGAAIYHPSSDSATPVGRGMLFATGHTAVRLNDGRVLVTGGVDANLGTFATGMIFDPAYISGPFLTRAPIESVTGGLRTAEISAVLDHHVPRTGVLSDWCFPYTCTSTNLCNTHPTPCEGPNQELHVLAFDGQLGNEIYGANEHPPGYRKSCEAEAFTFPQFQYLGTDGAPPPPCGDASLRDTYLNYDGHPGYDFAYGPTEWIVAAADGWLERPDDDYVNSPCSGNPTTFNQLRIRHSNGLETWYLHSVVGSE